MRTGRGMAVCLVVATLAVSAITATVQAASFASEPTATKSGGKTTIAFAVSAPTDCAVYIDDAQGRTVRHLAAGVIGGSGTAPEPLQAGLKQSLAWDGGDDDGQPAAGGPFRVSVGLGLRASWGGLAFSDTNACGPNMLEGLVTGIAVGPDGRAYVGEAHGVYTLGSVAKTLVFRRDGSYEKTIMPFSPTLPMERLVPAGTFVNSFGNVNPRQGPYEGRHIWFYPTLKVPFQTPAAMPDGRIYMAGDGGKTGAVVTVIGSDGGVPAVRGVDGPAASYAGPALNMIWQDAPFLAPASDGQALYVTRLAAFPKPPAKVTPSHAVHRIRVPERGPAEVFFGEPGTAGSDEKHLNDPRAVASDGRGHVLMADCGNNRIVAVNEADHSFAGSFAVKGPTWVGVHRKTGAVYVYGKAGRIIKFAGWRNAQQEVASVAAPSVYEPGLQRAETATLALDAQSEPAVIWMGAWDAKKGHQLLRCTDDGKTLSDLAPAKYYHPTSPWRVCTDPTRRLVLGWIGRQVWILDETSGQLRTFRNKGKWDSGGWPRLDRDGNVYMVDAGSPVRRYDRDGNPKPFAATGGSLPVGHRGNSAWERDFWVDRKGDIYVNRAGVKYHGLQTLEVFDQQGNLKRIALHSVTDGMYGPRVDTKGNIVILDSVEPPGQPFPSEFGGINAGIYDWFYGSVIKFGPRGGAAWPVNEPWSPVDFENWRAYGRVVNLRTTGGCLTANVVKGGKVPGIILVPGRIGTAIDADTCKTVSLRLKNGTDGTNAVIGFGKESVIGDLGQVYATIAVKPNSDFAEYTFDLAGAKDWKGRVSSIHISPSDTRGEGFFAIDWIRIGAGEKQKVYDFNAEESVETRLPADLKKEPVRASHWLPKGDLQGAQWIRPGFSAVSSQGNGGGLCHCFGTDFDMDDFGRIFAPDALRFRVGVLDANGNEITSIGAYGNQDFCGPDSYVLNLKDKSLRPRRADDPKDLVSPFAKPEIAFAWINGVAVTERHAYVTDLINKRVLLVKLDYATTETCEIK